MAKKKKPQKAHKAKAPATNDPGDLRNVEELARLVHQGNEEAQEALFMIGRDAVWSVQRVADETKDENLKALAKKLVAITPQVKTNLLDLRRDSVKALIRSALETAPQLAELAELTVPGTAVALF